MQNKNGKKVIVVGAGLGGISTALSLSLEGFDVTIYDKNDKVGGKLNVLKSDGYSFDLGPSILTLPYIFSRTFEKAGKRMEDYVPLEKVRPHWRNVFEDGTQVDLYPELDMLDKEAEKVGENPENVHKFLKYSEQLFDTVNRGYFENGLDDTKGFREFYGLKFFPKFDLFRSMHQSVSRHFDTKYFVDIFDFFIKYVGSSAYKAPAFMNCMSTIQFKYDLWYVMGGMYGLAQGLEKLMRELNINIVLNTEIHEILVSDNGRRVRGVRLENGTEDISDVVVSNMEVIPTYKYLLGESDTVMKKMKKKFEPSCSGLVIDIGLDKKFENLAHHNFFFSGNQRSHFADVFQKKKIPHDPTLYIVAASRTDVAVAPPGCDAVKILPHIPHLDPDNPIDDKEYFNLKERVYDKMERMGCKDLRKHIVFEHVWTPKDIQSQYNSNMGSIYGVVSDRFKNLAFKAPKECQKYPGLYFVGGSVNPGGGMPMVFLCGQNVARLVTQNLKSGVI